MSCTHVCLYTSVYSLFINPSPQIPKENDSGEKGRLSPVKACNVTNGSRSRYCHTSFSLSGHVFSKAHETCNLVVCQHEGQGTQTHADERRNVNSSGLMSMLLSWFGTVTLPGNVARVWIMGTMFPCNQVVHCRVAWGSWRVSNCLPGATIS